MDVNEALAKRNAIVAKVKQEGFKPDRKCPYTDAQIWQAVIDTAAAGHGSHPLNVVATLLGHVLEGRPVPSSPTYDTFPAPEATP